MTAMTKMKAYATFDLYLEDQPPKSEAAVLDLGVTRALEWSVDPENRASGTYSSHA